MIQSILYEKEIAVNDLIKIQIPSVEDVLRNEEHYNSLLTLTTATPFEMMVQLYDMGIDFTEISEFELFCLLLTGMKDVDMSMMFGELNLKGLGLQVNEANGDIRLVDEESGLIIDKSVYYHMSHVVRQINFIEKTNKRPANDEAKRFLLERARIKQRRAARRKQHSQLEELIVALVCTSEFPYDFDSVLKLSIFQFNASVRQVIKKINYDNTMIGCYAGTVNIKDLSKDQLNWLTSK